MKSHPPKPKTTPPPLFSCGLFRHCTQTVLSPTASSTPPNSPLPLQPQQSHQPPPPPLSSSSSSSSSNTSQSFTQWRFPLPPSSPISHHHSHPSPPPRITPHPHPITTTTTTTTTTTSSNPQEPPLLTAAVNFQRLFHAAEIKLNSDSDADRINALHMLERSLMDDGCGEAPCPASAMESVIGYVKEGGAGAKLATKVLLALCIAEGNRRVAVEVGAAGRVVEALAELEGAAAERALAALELICTVEEGAKEVRGHALAVPMMVEVMGKMDGRRGKECAMGVLGVIYSGGGLGQETERERVLPPAEEVARAIALALQGECSERGRRKGAHLLQMLQGRSGRLDHLTVEEEG